MDFFHGGVFKVVALMKNYLTNEDALDISVQQILYIVIAVVVVGVIGFFLFTTLSDNKSSAEDGLDKYENTVKSIQGLGR